MASLEAKRLLARSQAEAEAAREAARNDTVTWRSWAKGGRLMGFTDALERSCYNLEIEVLELHERKSLLSVTTYFHLRGKRSSMKALQDWMRGLL